VGAHVGGQAAVYSELLATLDAHERLDLVVHALYVLHHAAALREELVADVTCAVELLGVDALDVGGEAALLRVALAALVTLERLHL